MIIEGNVESGILFHMLPAYHVIQLKVFRDFEVQFSGTRASSHVGTRVNIPLTIHCELHFSHRSAMCKWSSTVTRVMPSLQTTISSATGRQPLRSNVSADNRHRTVCGAKFQQFDTTETASGGEEGGEAGREEDLSEDR